MRRGSGRLSVNVLGIEASLVGDVGEDVADAEDREDMVVTRRLGMAKLRGEVRRRSSE